MSKINNDSKQVKKYPGPAVMVKYYDIFGFGVCFRGLRENACLWIVITRVTISFLCQGCISTTSYNKPFYNSYAELSRMSHKFTGYLYLFHAVRYLHWFLFYLMS